MLADQILDIIGFLRAQLAERAGSQAPDTPEFVIALVDSDPIKPGEKRPPGVELGQGEIDFGEDFLRDILKVFLKSKVMIGEVQNRLLIFSYQLFKCELLPVPASGDKLAVFICIGFLPHKINPTLFRSCRSSGNPLQSFCGGLQSGVSFAETKADIAGTSFRLMEEAASRNDCNPDILYEVVREIAIVKRAQRSESRHNIVRTLRR